MTGEALPGGKQRGVHPGLIDAVDLNDLKFCPSDTSAATVI